MGVGGGERERGKSGSGRRDGEGEMDSIVIP